MKDALIHEQLYYEKVPQENKKKIIVKLTLEHLPGMKSF